MQVPYWLTYDFPPQVREKLKNQWGSDWKGQAQKWLVHFTYIHLDVSFTFGVWSSSGHVNEMDD